MHDKVVFANTFSTMRKDVHHEAPVAFSVRSITKRAHPECNVRVGWPRLGTWLRFQDVGELVFWDARTAKIFDRCSGGPTHGHMTWT